MGLNGYLLVDYCGDRYCLVCLVGIVKFKGNGVGGLNNVEFCFWRICIKRDVIVIVGFC